MTVTATKIDSSHESAKKFITYAWPASTTIIYNNPVQGIPTRSFRSYISIIYRPIFVKFGI
jgi:hypothetical protein